MALLLVLGLPLLFGCNRSFRPAVTEPPPATTTSKAPGGKTPPATPPEPTPKPAPEPTDLSLAAVEAGEAKIQAGDWHGAAADFDRLLAGPAGEHLDRILMRAALVRLHPASPLRRPERGYAYLERLLAERPDSAYAAEATLILTLARERSSLAAEVERLESQLDELRRIDLEPPP